MPVLCLTGSGKGKIIGGMTTLFASDFGQLIPWWVYAIPIVAAVFFIACFIYFVATVTRRDDEPEVKNRDSN
jgi:hypothetical protein